MSKEKTKHMVVFRSTDSFFILNRETKRYYWLSLPLNNFRDCFANVLEGGGVSWSPFFLGSSHDGSLKQVSKALGKHFVRVIL